MASPNPTSLPELHVDLTVLNRRGVDRHPIVVELPATWLSAVLQRTDAEVRSPGHAKLELFVQPNGTLLLTGKVTASFEVPCARCLDPAQVDAGAEICTTFIRDASLDVAADLADDEDDFELSEQDLDTWGYDGVNVDIEAVVEEQIKVAYPMRAFCSRGEQCLGLCSQCGASLNEQVADKGGSPAPERCGACGAKVLGPVDPPNTPEGARAAEVETPADPDDPDRERPLAKALRKLRLPD